VLQEACVTEGGTSGFFLVLWAFLGDSGGFFWGITSFLGVLQGWFWVVSNVFGLLRAFFGWYRTSLKSYYGPFHLTRPPPSFPGGKTHPSVLKQTPATSHTVKT